MTLVVPDRAARSVECAITRAAGGRAIPGNRVQLLIDGPDAYATMLDVIARARAWIHFENYIIRSDDAGWRFAEALAKRAREGVHVRVLYDWLGSLATARRYWRYLRDAGAEVRVFHPPRLIDFLANFSRNHRKMVVGDGSRAVIGGLCIGNEWTGEGEPGGKSWRDTAVEIAGPAAAAIDTAFQGTWGLTGGVVPPTDVPGSVAPQGDADVRVICGEPGRERTYRVVEYLAAGATERLWITDAYMVAPPRLFQALHDAARDGVDVRLLLPGSSDLPLVRNLTRIGYRDLLRSGVRIYEWDGPMLHAKTVSSDNRWVRVGSSNLNASSLIGNWELDVLIEDTVLADKVECQFRQDIARSHEVSRRPMRAPRRISDVMPAVLARGEPEAPMSYRRSRRESRRRAVVALRALVTHARRSVFGPITVFLVALSFFFIALPRITAYIFGGLCIWLAIAAGKEALRRRSDR